jgi:hypothetical protein
VKAGDVVRVALPQADGKQKARPAILLASFPPFGDWLVVGISGSLGLEVKGLDVRLDQQHPAFQSTRLGSPGIIRMGHAHVVPVAWIEGVMGRLDDPTLQLLRKRLADHILRGG